MRRILGVVLGLALLLPITIQGQEWTAEQEDLWAWEISCWQTEDIQTAMACLHEDFVGWGLGNPVPVNKEDKRPGWARSFETTEQVFLNLKPISVQIHGNSAVLVYVATSVIRDKATGEETRYVELWTDVALRDGGQWYWIADHGTTFEGER